MTRTGLSLVVYGQPVSKKNSMQLILAGKRIIPVPSKRYREWLKSAKEQILGLTFVAGLPMTGPVHLTVLAYRWGRMSIDLSNIIEAVQDMLQSVGVLEDDSQVRSLDGSRVFFGVPRDEARVEITIERVLVL